MPNRQLYRIATARNNRNLVEFITSHDDPQPGQGNIVKQVQHPYNGWRRRHGIGPAR